VLYSDINKINERVGTIVKKATFPVQNELF
jgi:hypothetical protein